MPSYAVMRVCSATYSVPFLNTMPLGVSSPFSTFFTSRLPPPSTTA